MTLSKTFVSLLLLSILSLGTLHGGAVQAQDASGLSAEELESMFKKQKTRGLVLAPAGQVPEAPATPDPAAPVTEAAAPATPAEPAATTYVANDDGTAVNIQIKFDFDSAALREDQKPKLVSLCTVMQNNADWVFRIVGHTDAAGSADYNYRLSLLRAEEVKRYLASSCNVGADRLQAIGVGKDYLANEADPRGEENRRVEFQLIS